MAKKKKAKKKKTKKQPSSNGNTVRDSHGHFIKGNKCSKGNLGNTNIHARELKEALLNAVNKTDIQAIVKKLMEKAKTGNIQAVKELFDRLFGKPKETVDQNVSLLGVVKNIPSTQEAYGEMQDYMKSKDGIDRKSINGNGNGDKKNS